MATLLDQEVGRQTCVAISSGESEFHASTLCAARLIFTRSLVDGFGFPHVEGPTAYSDVLSSEGYCESQGVGKLKHLQVRSLWLTAGTGGRTGESRQGRHVAEHGRRWAPSFLTSARRKQLIGMLLPART